MFILAVPLLIGACRPGAPAPPAAFGITPTAPQETPDDSIRLAMDTVVSPTEPVQPPEATLAPVSIGTPTSPPLDEEPFNENGEPQVEWGQEVSLDEFVELAKSGNAVEIQWYVMPNAIRILMTDNSLYHFQNARVGADIVRVLEREGVEVGKGGLPIRYSFCE
jgi:hypothetical protein